MKARKILLLLPSYTPNDAVGNDVTVQREVLEEHGFDVAVFAEHVHQELASGVLNRSSLMRWLADPAVLMIVQHAIYWPMLDEILMQAKCEVWIRYQNITPAKFFKPYSDMAAKACLLGRKQAKSLVKAACVSCFVPASTYSADELVTMGLSRDRATVLPPFHRAEEFKTTANFLPEGFRTDEFNVLFVGRVSPNKGHKHMIEVVRHYRAMFGDDIRLNIVGGYGVDLVSYKRELDARVEAYDLGQHVRFWQHLPFSHVAGMYKESAAFLLMSEHEGFCVPVLEAQISGIPVVAHSCSAVTETLGDQQLCFNGFEYGRYAAALHVLKDREVSDLLVRNGRRNAARFTRQRISNSFIKLIAERAS